MKNLTGKRIALIGGAGFVGHHLALRLKALGAEPHIIDGLQVNNLGAFTSNLHQDPNADLYVGFINERLLMLRQAGIRMHIVDARDYDLLTSHMQAIKPDAAVHLAAVAHANKANKDPYNTFDHSLRTLENALDTVRTRKPHFIYVSSSMVYGDIKGRIVSEDHECNPIGIQGALKLSGEKLVIAYNQVFDLPYTILRPTTLYGERCVSRHVGQSLIENAVLGKPVVVEGDSAESFDFTFIDDFIAGIIACIGNEAAHAQILNMSFGQARPIDDMLGILKDRFPGIQVVHRPRERPAAETGTLDIAKARKLLGYAPEHPLERGYASYVDWYKALAKRSPELFAAARPASPQAAK